MNSFDYRGGFSKHNKIFEIDKTNLAMTCAPELPMRFIKKMKKNIINTILICIQVTVRCNIVFESLYFCNYIIQLTLRFIE